MRRNERVYIDFWLRQFVTDDHHTIPSHPFPRRCLLDRSNRSLIPGPSFYFLQMGRHKSCRVREFAIRPRIYICVGYTRNSRRNDISCTFIETFVAMNVARLVNEEENFASLRSNRFSFSSSILGGFSKYKVTRRREMDHSIQLTSSSPSIPFFFFFLGLKDFLIT